METTVLPFESRVIRGSFDSSSAVFLPAFPPAAAGVAPRLFTQRPTPLATATMIMITRISRFTVSPFLFAPSGPLRAPATFPTGFGLPLRVGPGLAGPGFARPDRQAHWQ